MFSAFEMEGVFKTIARTVSPAPLGESFLKVRKPFLIARSNFKSHLYLIEPVFTSNKWIKDHHYKDGWWLSMRYPTDLTDSRWELIKGHFAGMRTYKWSKIELINVVLYFEGSGCQWRLLLHGFPPYATEWSFYRRAKLLGLRERILHDLVEKIRINQGVA